MGESILGQIIGILVDGLIEFGTGIGSGVGSMVSSLFLVEAEGATTLSTFGTLVVVFSAVALTIGLSRWVMNWVTSFGN